MSEQTADTKEHKPDTWLVRVLNWRLIRGFGKSPLATFSIAMPFVGYVILYHSEIAHYLGDMGGLLAVQEGVLNRDSALAADENRAGMSFFTKLNLFYLGSCFVGAGTVVFRFVAPVTIKEFGTASQFVEAELGRATARKLRTMVIAIKARRPTVAAPLLTIAPWLNRKKMKLKQASNELRALKDDQLQIDILSSFYNVEDRYSQRWAVYLTTLLYVIGFTLISIPGLSFTVRVLRIVILQITGNS